MEDVRLELCDEEEVEEDEEDEVGADEDEEDEFCEFADEVLELAGMLPIRPVNRPKIGSAQRLLLQVVAVSRVKRPV